MSEDGTGTDAGLLFVATRTVSMDAANTLRRAIKAGASYAAQAEQRHCAHVFEGAASACDARGWHETSAMWRLAALAMAAADMSSVAMIPDARRALKGLNAAHKLMHKALRAMAKDVRKSSPRKRR